VVVVVPLVLVVQVLEPLGMVIIKVEFGISQPDGAFLFIRN
jgi:hypothetical protein